MEKQLNEMTVIELKALLFDIDQEVKRLQQNSQIVGDELIKKLNEGKEDGAAKE